ncbi:hypothetical protein, partial [uncultured Gammaproteobacteria bacterium]
CSFFIIKTIKMPYLEEKPKVEFTISSTESICACKFLIMKMTMNIFLTLLKTRL